MRSWKKCLAAVCAATCAAVAFAAGDRKPDVALRFHGVIGQSAAPNEKPLGFTGVKSLIELPGERVLFVGDDGGLYEIRDGRPFATGKPARGSFLDFDGRTLRALGQYSGVWEFDLATLDAKRIVGPNGVRWDLAGVRPETPNHPFADRCKFVTWDPKGDRMMAYDEKCAELGELFPLPERKDKCRIEGFGFMPGSGDLLVVSYWPDCHIFRFRPNGDQVLTDGWPVRRGFGYLRTSGGRIWHAGTPSVLPLQDNMVYQKAFSASPECELTGYARQGGCEFVGTSQGLYVKEPGELGFNRRFGGIGRLTALAINDGYVFLSMGEKIRWLRLDGDEYEPFGSSDALGLRINNGNNWADRIVDMAPDGPGWIKVATGKAGRWRFRRVPPVEYVNHRKLWIRESADACVKVTEKTPSAKLLDLLAKADVPGGLEVGKIAAQGKWLVVEDVRNRRLLRFKVTKER